MRLVAKSIPQGAATQVLAAVSPDLDGHAGPSSSPDTYRNQLLARQAHCIHLSTGSKWNSGRRAALAEAQVVHKRILSNILYIYEKAAAESVVEYCCLGAGAYLVDCAIATPWAKARDMDMAAKLWDQTEKEIAEALSQKSDAAS